MGRETYIQDSFTAGEVSPYLGGQVRLTAYRNGLRYCQNFLPLPYGLIDKRPGTRFVAEVKNSAKKVRLIPFIFSETQAYALEFGETTGGTGYMRAFYQEGQLYSGATIYEITSPYTATQLTGATRVKYSQSADVMYMAHVNVEPYKLSRTGHTNWTLATFTITGAPTAWTGATQPGAVAFFEQRLWLSGTPQYPQTNWSSKSGDYENFTTGATADYGLEYTIASENVNKIRWLVPHSRMVIGTLGAEWTAGAQSSLDPITPTNIRMDRQSTHGASDVPGRLINHTVLFINQHGKKLIEFGYDWELNGFKGRDLSLLSEHLTTAYQINAFAWAQDPDHIIYSVRNDGVLLSTTHYPPEQVLAWARQVTRAGDEIEDLCIIPYDNRDEVWLSVKRTINGSTKRYIEFIENKFGHETHVRDAFFVDSGLSYEDAQAITAVSTSSPIQITTTASHGWSQGDEVLVDGLLGYTPMNGLKYTAATGTTGVTVVVSGFDGSAATTWTSGGTLWKTASKLSGLSHLEACTVSVLTDGAVHADQVVTGGSITLLWTAGVAHVGLPYESVMETMDLEAGANEGTAQSKIGRIHQAAVRFYRTVNGSIGPDADNMDTIPFRKTGDAMDSPPALASEDIVQHMPGDYDRPKRVRVEHNSPTPCTILAVIPQVSTHDQ